MSVVFSVLASLFLLVMSGLFSGLTLGLLGLDPLSLQIVANGDTGNAVYARKIIPIREKGNLLLCTLLLGNVAVNAALAILLADFAGGLSGFILSTAFIVIFGEIIPQAACNRYALYIGSKVIRIVQVLILLILPLAWPISKCLDWLLGDELGTIYTNRELQNLLEVHTTQGDLPKDSAKIMKGALDFSKLTIANVMTEWQEVFYLYSDINLDFDALERIFKSGHSRVPVITRPTRNEGSQVIGLLFVKDLILLDPEDELPVENIIDTFHHDLKLLDFNADVKTVMSEFLHGRSHLAIVRDQVASKKNGDIIYENVGIVTLEDIIENILKMEIEDEFDYGVAAPSDKSRNDEILKLFDYRRTRGMEGMPPQEKLVVYRHLCREVEVFMQQHRAVEDVDLQNLLASGSVHKVIQDSWIRERNSDPGAKANLMIEEGGHLLYSKGVQTEFFTFILDGKAEVYSGRQKFRSEVSRFTILCPELFTQTQRDHKEGLEFSAFVPDFTARIIQNSRVLRIPRENFLKCLLGKLRNYSRPIKETRDKLREINQHKMSEGNFSMRSRYDSSTNAYASVPLISHMNSSSELKSKTMPPLLKGQSSSRQRFYDETYVGHEYEAEGKRKEVQSSPNLTSGSDNKTKSSADNETSEVQVLEVA